MYAPRRPTVKMVKNMLRPKDRRKWFFCGAVLEVQDHMVLHKYHESSFWSLKSAYLLSTIHIKISPHSCPVLFEKQRGSISFRSSKTEGDETFIIPKHSDPHAFPDLRSDC